MTPVPVENGIPAQCCVVLREGRWRTAFLMPDGDKQPFGQPYPTAAAAARASLKVNEQIVGWLA
jgi:hypothetical protein